MIYHLQEPEFGNAESNAHLGWPAMADLTATPLRDVIRFVSEVRGWINLISDRMITQPKSLAAHDARLPENKIAEIEQRDGRKSSEVLEDQG